MTDFLLWLDLETTGSDETKDSIIEVGCILTTPDLTVRGEMSWLVTPTDEALGRLLRLKVVREMHEANGLLDMVLDGLGQSPHNVASMVLNWIDDTTDHDDSASIVLAGSGVGHFDRRFLKRWMPQVDRRLRHWCIDVGVLRRAHDLWVGTEVSTANDAKTHRALDDARCHLEEARAFAALWQQLRVEVPA